MTIFLLIFRARMNYLIHRQGEDSRAHQMLVQVLPSPNYVDY